MNAEFVKALLGAGNEIHAVGLVVNIQERSGLQIQLMIGLLHELKVDLKHILIVFTHGDSILPTPPPTDLRKRCEKRYQLVPQHITGLDCLQSLVANVKRRYLVVESLQLSERDIIIEQLFEHIDSMAAHPMTNDTFLNSLQWWNEQQGNREREEKELKEAKDKLAKLRSEQAKTDVQKLRSKHRHLEDECSDLSSKLDKISEMKKILEDVLQVESDITECIADIAAVNMELRTVKDKESVLCKQQSTLKELEYKVKQNFEDMSRNYTEACCDVISHRDKGIATLSKAADEVDALKKRATIAKISGFSAGIVGGVLFTVGAGLLLGGITAPIAIPFVAAGGAVGAAGTVTTIGGTVGRLVKKNMIIKQAKSWLEGNRNRCTDLIHKHAVLNEEHGHIDEVFPRLAKLPKGTEQIGKIVSVWREAIRDSAESATQVLVLAAQGSLGIAQSLVEVTDATAQLVAVGVKVGAKAAGGVVVGLSGLVILLDLGLLVKSSYELDRVVRQGKRTKTAQALINLAEALKKENNSMREAITGAASEPTDDLTDNIYVICNHSTGNEDQLQDSPTDDLEPNLNNQGESHSTNGAHTSGARVDEINHGDDASMISLTTKEVGECPSVCILPQSTDSSDTSEGSIQEDDRTQLHSASDHSLSDSPSIVPINDVPEADTSDTRNRYSCIIS